MDGLCVGSSSLSLLSSSVLSPRSLSNEDADVCEAAGGKAFLKWIWKLICLLASICLNTWRWWRLWMNYEMKSIYNSLKLGK